MKKIILGVVFLLLPIAAIAANIFPDLGGLGLSSRPIYDIIANLVKWLLAIFGFIAIIGFVIGGIQYLISAGDEDMQKRAKKTFIYSIIGVIVGLSGLVVITAIQNMLGASTSNF
ncbi:MAG: hypothetical protein A3J76_03965 [Candidatus Moranbacteria bacterium RBG_13_45_13]|nr:MAG: hypothetical protein A3J76_03965 [Candidatus Moranbacteria bacterium RBG_13_45_13]